MNVANFSIVKLKGLSEQAILIQLLKNFLLFIYLYIYMQFI
jgi:hypothetical protein